MNSLYSYFDYLLGLTNNSITLWHMILRILIIYIFGILILTSLNRRFLAEKTPFDIILRFVIGSSLASAITGGAPYLPTLGMVLFIICVHWVLSLLSLYNKQIDVLIKGRAVLLFKDGKYQTKAMMKHHFTIEDIKSEIRKETGIADVAQVDQVILENSGEISVIPKKRTNSHASLKTDDPDD
jgi:uncharacterized membrane protein YcaP (DUF421 family)